MNARPLLLITTLIASLTGCPGGQRGGGVGPVSNSNPLTENWILLSEPSMGGNIEIGSAYDPRGGAINVGCYAVSEVSDSTKVLQQSWDKIELRWTRSSTDSAFLKVAKVLNIDAGLTRASGAYLRLDSVRIRRAVNIVPSATCPAVNADGMPMRPGIAALIGASRFVFAAWDERQRSIAPTLLAEGAFANTGFRHVDRKADSLSVQVGGFRWLGAQFTTYEPETSARRDTLGPFSLQEVIEIPPRFELRVTWKEGPMYYVASRSINPVGSWVRDSVEINQTFVLGGRTNSSRGTWTNARIYVDTANRVTVVTDRRGARPKTWAGERERARLYAWIDGR